MAFPYVASSSGPSSNVVITGPLPVPVSDNGGSLTVDGTVTANAGTGPFPVSDNGGSLTVDSTQLPAALAAGGGIKVEGVSGGVTVPVIFPAYTAPASGELAGSATAAQMPNIACKLVMFAAEASNAGKVYIGISGVTKPDGSTDTTTGFELAAGQATPWVPVDNLNRLYRICDNAGDDLTYLLMI